MAQVLESHAPCFPNEGSTKATLQEQDQRCPIGTFSLTVNVFSSLLLVFSLSFIFGTKQALPKTPFLEKCNHSKIYCLNIVFNIFPIHKILLCLDMRLSFEGCVLILVWLTEMVSMLVLKQRRAKRDGPALLTTYSKFLDINCSCMSSGEKQALTGRGGGCKEQQSKFTFLIGSKVNVILRQCSIRSFELGACSWSSLISAR